MNGNSQIWIDHPDELNALLVVHCDHEHWQFWRWDCRAAEVD
jgi:hypothetical protein